MATLIAPHVDELKDRIEREKQAYAEVKNLLDKKQKPKLYVEGASDKLIIERALRVFAPNKANKIDVVTKDDNGGGGVNYVIDMLKAWRDMAKHENVPRVAGLLDDDCEARKGRGEYRKSSGKRVQDAPECFLLETPPHIQNICDKRITIPVVLECLYDHKAWEWAHDNRYLSKREDILSLMSEAQRYKISNTEATWKNFVNDDEMLFVEYEFSQEGKGKMARHFAGKRISDDEFRERLACLEPLVTKIADYLLPEAES